MCTWSTELCVRGVLNDVSVEYWMMCLWSTEWCVCGVLNYESVEYWMMCLWSTEWWVCGVLNDVYVEYWMMCLWSTEWCVCGVLHYESVEYWMMCTWMWSTEWCVCGVLNDVYVQYWMMCLWSTEWWICGWSSPHPLQSLSLSSLSACLLLCHCHEMRDVWWILNTDISQGSVVTCFRWGGMFNNHFIANFHLSVHCWCIDTTKRTGDNIRCTFSWAEVCAGICWSNMSCS